MTLPFDQEKREFIRVRLEIPVRYKFICQHINNLMIEKTYQGSCNNISASGLLLTGQVPDFNWVPDMLLQKIVLGLYFLLPGELDMVKVIARAAWVGTLDEKTHDCQMGLKFKELTSEDKDQILRFIIKSQLPSQ